MSQTSIQWTDARWNPVTGCTKVSPGCKHCYAEGVANRFFRKQYPPVQCAVDDPRTKVRDAWRVELLGTTGQPGLRFREFTDVQTHVDRLDQPLRWKKPRKVFVNSMSDLFHEDVPDAFIDQVFAVMALAPQHTFQILTKRAERMRVYLLALAERLGELWDLTNQPTWIMLPAGRSFPRWPENWPLPNVWLGVSVENQQYADARIPLLLRTPAAVRFISAEPLLGPVNFRWAKWDDWSPSTRRRADRCPSITRDGKRLAGCVNELDGLRMLDWVIVGGESGNGARPFDVEWARSIIAQCKSASVPVFMKQMGTRIIDRNDAGFEGDTPNSWPMDTDSLEEIANRCQADPVRIVLNDRKGGDMAEWPADLRVREFPR